MLKNARAINNIIVNRDDPGGDYESPQTGTTAEEVMEYYLGAFIGGAYTGAGCGSRDGQHFSYMYIGGNFSPHVMKSAEKLKCMRNIIDDMIFFWLMRSLSLIHISEPTRLQV